MNGHDHLYEASIDELNLSEEGSSFLVKLGITSIGDCIDLYNRGKDAMISVPPGYFEMEQAIKAELEEKLLEFDVRLV